MLISKCYLKDIREYEELNNKNILDLVNVISVTNMAQLILIFNKKVSTEEEACNLIDEYISETEMSLFDIHKELLNALLGYNKTENTKEQEDAENDITEFQLLSDYYMKLCMQLMSIGVTYQEFWNFTTKEMYQVYDAIQQKYVNDFNMEMEKQHIAAGLIAGAVWGKPAKKAPKIELNKNEDLDKEIDTPYGRMTIAAYRSTKELMKMEG